MTPQDFKNSRTWKLHISYVLPPDPDLLGPARALAADALDQRTMVLQTCTNPETRLTCENDAEIAFREKISAIPGAKFVLGYRDHTFQMRSLLDLTSEEAIDPYFNRSFNHLRPNTWAEMGVAIWERTTQEAIRFDLIEGESVLNVLNTTSEHQDLVGVLWRAIRANEDDEKLDALSLVLAPQLNSNARRTLGYLFDLGISTEDLFFAFRQSMSQGDLELARLLLAQQNVVDYVGPAAYYAQRETLLFTYVVPIGTAADVEKHVEKATFLLENGADANAKRDRGTTPLMYAMTSLQFCKTDDAAARIVATAELLLEHGADVNAMSGNGYTPLRELVANVSTVASDVASRTLIELAKLLLEHGADVNLGVPLVYLMFEVSDLKPGLASHFVVELAELFIDHGADVNRTDIAIGSHYTPLMQLMTVLSKRTAKKEKEADERLRIDLATILLDHHADAQVQVNGHTASSIATSHGLDACAKLIEERTKVT
jgi:hypothetical protein